MIIRHEDSEKRIIRQEDQLSVASSKLPPIYLIVVYLLAEDRLSSVCYMTGDERQSSLLIIFSFGCVELIKLLAQPRHASVRGGVLVLVVSWHW